MFDKLATLVELALLARILWQGEFILKYERDTYLLASSREQERKDWRNRKKAAVLKKESEVHTGAEQ